MNYHVKDKNASELKRQLKLSPLGSHPCPVKECRTIVNPRNMMCKVHWAMVTVDTKNQVYSTWNKGTATGSYLAATGKAIREAENGEI